MSNLPKNEPEQILIDIVHAIAEKYNAGEKGIDLDNFAERIQAYGDTRELEGRIETYESLLQASTVATSPVFDPLSGVGRVEITEYLNELKALKDKTQ